MTTQSDSAKSIEVKPPGLGASYDGVVALGNETYVLGSSFWRRIHGQLFFKREDVVIEVAERTDFSHLVLNQGFFQVEHLLGVIQSNGPDFDFQPFVGLGLNR